MTSAARAYGVLLGILLNFIGVAVGTAPDAGTAATLITADGWLLFLLAAVSRRSHIRLPARR